ncbi:response regulator [Acetivibrio cellulolyticus]|uniref:response regulator n=1 Tax=Acetivibrio cellulolyticus TaxID=35830 RepID=UPI0001E2D43E|nr:response regulator transcription factor [Acetivibrio cellulolyticus]
MIKVVLVDDQVILRESLKFIVEQDPEIKVVGLGSNGEEALNLCGELAPDVVLMDIMMPVCNGVEGTKLIKSKFQSIKVIILTTFNDEENISKAIKNGADGYVLKDIKPDDLIVAVKSVAKGFSIMHHTALNTVAKQINHDKEPTQRKQEPKFDINLTDRELSIIKLIVDGKSNKEIALSIFITEGSVKNIITNILEKLNLKDRTQLAVFAVKNNIV